MREVIPNLLSIGNAWDGRDLRSLHASGILAVVDLAYEEPPALLSRDLIYCRFPLLDGAGNSPAVLQIAIDTVVSLCQAAFPTLVCCSAGMSRSPAITAAALARIWGRSEDTCLTEIAAGGVHDVSPLLWQEILQSCAH